MLDSPDIACQTEWRTKSERYLGLSTEEFAKYFVHFNDIGKSSLGIKIGSVDFFQIASVPNDGSGAIHIRHVMIAKYNLLSDGLCLDVIDIVIQYGHINTIFFLDFQRSGRQQIRCCIKLFGGCFDFFHGEFMHLCAYWNAIWNALHRRVKPISTLLECNIVLFQIHLCYLTPSRSNIRYALIIIPGRTRCRH